MQRHVTYQFDGPSQLTQLPGSSTYSCNTAEEFEDVLSHVSKDDVFEDARSRFSLDTEEEDERPRTAQVFEGPQDLLSRAGREIAERMGQRGYLSETFSRDDAIEHLGNNPVADELVINRLLKRSYGVNARVPFEEGKHDPDHKKKDFGGEDWCDGIIFWMAYKDDPVKPMCHSSNKFFRDFQVRDDETYIAKEYLYACDTPVDQNFKDTPRYKPQNQDNEGANPRVNQVPLEIEQLCEMGLNVSSLRPPADEELTSTAGVKYFKINFDLCLSFEANLVLGFMAEANKEPLARVTVTYDTT